MGIPVLILGESGSGKSCSLRNFEPDEIGIFNVASKPLPFRKKLPKADRANYQTILAGLNKKSRKTYVIDDSQYLMAFELFDRAKESGYGKFTDFALNFENLVQYVIEFLPEDTIVYFLHHIQQGENGKIKAKTVGKMLDEKLTLEGLFSVVLMAETDGERYWFRTKTNGSDTVKSPMGMFEDTQIDNDLKIVDQAIRDYWELSPLKNQNKE